LSIADTAERQGPRLQQAEGIAFFRLCNSAKEQHVIAPLAKLLDWLSMQAATLMMPADDLDSKLEEAIQFLKGPDFIPAESQPAQVEFNGALHFVFPTPRPCEFAQNNFAHGRLYRCAGR
jgi:hypothetical protein